MASEAEIKAAARVIAEYIEKGGFSAFVIARAALEAAERVRGDGWRTIDSAPTDGTPVLVARDMGDPWGWVRGTAYWVDVRGISGWVARGITDPPGELGLGGPTHWRPLPPPPQDCT